MWTRKDICVEILWDMMTIYEEHKVVYDFKYGYMCISYFNVYILIVLLLNCCSVTTIVGSCLYYPPNCSPVNFILTTICTIISLHDHDIKFSCIVLQRKYLSNIWHSRNWFWIYLDHYSQALCVLIQLLWIRIKLNVSKFV